MQTGWVFGYFMLASAALALLVFPHWRQALALRWQRWWQRGRTQGQRAGQHLGAQVRQNVGGKALFIVNDRVDVALALDADGVQLPETGLPVAQARKLLGNQRLIGRSVHSLQGAVAAERAGADYVIFGPVYTTPSHSGVPPAGRQALQEVAQAVSIPVLAIGGVSGENIRQVLQAGAAGAAVVSAIIGALDSKAAAAELVARLSS